MRVRQPRKSRALLGLGEPRVRPWAGSHQHAAPRSRVLSWLTKRHYASREERTASASSHRRSTPFRRSQPAMWPILV